MSKNDNGMRGYNKHFKNFVSKEVKDFATNQVLGGSKYLFVIRENKQKIAYCTHCRKEHVIKGSYKHNDAEVCPKCRNLCTVKDTRYKHTKLYNCAYFHFFKKSKVDNQIVVGGLCYTSRDYRNEFRNIETEIEVVERYYFTLGQAKRWERYWWGEGRWTGCNKVKAPSINLRWVYNEKSLRNAVKGTPFDHVYNDCFEKYEHAIYQLAEFCKYPFIEMLYKGPFGDLMKSHSYGACTYRSLNWKAKTPYGFFKLSKNCYERIKNEAVDFWRLHLIQQLEKLNCKWIYAHVKKIENAFRCIQNDREFNLCDLFEILSPEKIVNYIDKQVRAMPNTEKEEILAYTREHTMAIDWLDYLNECVALSYDLTDSQINRPKNLGDAHRRTSGIITQLEDEERKKRDKEEMEKFAERYQKLYDYFYFEYGDYFIKPAESTGEIVNEGKHLSHCVGGYAKRHMEGKTNIFFIREKNNPCKSFFTLEIKNLKDKSIYQCRGLRNISYTQNETVCAFVNEFIKQRLLKKRNRRKSA